MHAVIEEQLFYPVTRATVPEIEDIALERVGAGNAIGVLAGPGSWRGSVSGCDEADWAGQGLPVPDRCFRVSVG